MLMTPNTPHSRTKQTAPREQDIARLKKRGIKWERMFVVKLTIAATGKQRSSMRKRFFQIGSFEEVAFSIMRMFNYDARAIHTPMPITTAFMPIYLGKNQIERSMKMAPTM